MEHQLRSSWLLAQLSRARASPPLPRAGPGLSLPPEGGGVRLWRCHACAWQGGGLLELLLHTTWVAPSLATPAPARRSDRSGRPRDLVAAGQPRAGWQSAQQACRTARRCPALALVYWALRHRCSMT